MLFQYDIFTLFKWLIVDNCLLVFLSYHCCCCWLQYDDVLFFSFCFCLLLLLLLLVCLLVCSFFPFAKLVLFRFLSWFSKSLTCSVYIRHVIFFCTLVLGSTNIFYYIAIKLCHFFVYLKVDSGQLESLCYFDHHTHV